jgi:hypothetical protein
VWEREKKKKKKKKSWRTTTPALVEPVFNGCCSGPSTALARGVGVVLLLHEALMEGQVSTLSNMVFALGDL